MANIRISADIPYLLLPAGLYPTSLDGSLLRLEEVSKSSPDGAVELRTNASIVFNADDGTDAETATPTRHRQADWLLRHVNSLLRWYRVATRQPNIVELTLAQASPFWFTFEATDEVWGGDAPLEYEPQSPLPADGSRAEFAAFVREGLSGKTEPDVATLNLLDAEYALSIGRFREAVLLCWGAIDSTFVRKFESLVDDRLKDDYADGRDFVKGLDFGLRRKMTVGLNLLAGRSLYQEPNGFWEKLSTSYGLRNKIIHEGQIAHEVDAKQAIAVAHEIVRIVNSLSPS